MYILIGGGGQVGLYLTKGLLEQGHEVLLLEKDFRRVKQLQEELGTSVVQGDACEARTLENVGCERANLVIAVTGDDEDNLVICQLAKARFKVPRTIARVNNPRYDELFSQLGIDVTVSPTRTILHMIEAEIPHRAVVPLMTLTQAGLQFVEVTVPEDSPNAYKTLRSLDLPATVNLALVVRGHQNITPTGETEIVPEDRVFALVTDEGEAALRAALLPETA
ncbi:MAG TPA: TrkA family potassium uptake protein [Ktedonobacterales bacterium]|nr:TrkA family potassium uptake protein [Ktedonobacterales bacterium]